MEFKSLNIKPIIIDNLKKNNIIKPTPIQIEAIPIILKNYDLLAKAPTGTGKTAAYVVPLVEMLSNSQKKYHSQILVLSPTRELSLQIANTFKLVSKKLNLKIVSIIGGESIKKQTQYLKNGSDIIVGTPGRVMDLINKKILNLSDTKFFVLDEADLMLDMGFIKDINFIKEMLPKKIQTILLSATIPKQIEMLAKKTLNQNYKYIATSKINETKTNIKQYFCCVEHNKKNKLLLSIINQHQNKTFIIFINTKNVSKYISRFLYENKIYCQIIHGDKSQAFRSKAINDFKNKKINVLIATDVASRGIHIDNVNFVINYDVPNNKESYIHRIGRTGRAYNNGIAYTLISPNDYFFLKNILTIKNNQYEIYNSDLTIPFDIQKIKSAKIQTTKKNFHNQLLTYKNNKNYESKKDKKRQKFVEEHNERYKLKKTIDEFKWGNNKQIKKNNYHKK